MSRGQARREITPDSLRASMGSRSWFEDHAAQLVDEAPGAHQDIDQVMADRPDLVKVLHKLRSVVNYKGR
jgi:tRNA-splicing ligase RtcB